MYKYGVLYPGAFRGDPRPKKPVQQDLFKQSPFKNCMDAMVDAYNGLIEAKDECKDVCNIAYETYTQKLRHGDPDPPSQKAMEKVAKAMAEEKTAKLSKELRETSDTLQRATRDEAQGELFKK